MCDAIWYSKKYRIGGKPKLIIIVRRKCKAFVKSLKWSILAKVLSRSETTRFSSAHLFKCVWTDTRAVVNQSIFGSQRKKILIFTI